MDEVEDGFGQVFFSSDMISINVMLLAIQGITGEKKNSCGLFPEK